MFKFFLFCNKSERAFKYVSKTLTVPERLFVIFILILLFCQLVSQVVIIIQFHLFVQKLNCRFPPNEKGLGSPEGFNSEGQFNPGKPEKNDVMLRWNPFILVSSWFLRDFRINSDMRTKWDRLPFASTRVPDILIVDCDTSQNL